MNRSIHVETDQEVHYAPGELSGIVRSRRQASLGCSRRHLDQTDWTVDSIPSSHNPLVYFFASVPSALPNLD